VDVASDAESAATAKGDVDSSRSAEIAPAALNEILRKRMGRLSFYAARKLADLCRVVI
jgi:hypothetical protein